MPLTMNAANNWPKCIGTNTPFETRVGAAVPSHAQPLAWPVRCSPCRSSRVFNLYNVEVVATFSILAVLIGAVIT